MYIVNSALKMDVTCVSCLFQFITHMYITHLNWLACEVVS